MALMPGRRRVSALSQAATPQAEAGACPLVPNMHRSTQAPFMPKEAQRWRGKPALLATSLQPLV